MPEDREKLARFREKLMTGRLVRTWESAKDLRAEVALSLPKTIKTYPGVGWVRGDTAASSEILAQVNNLRDENALLRDKILKIEENSAHMIDELANGKDVFTIRCSIFAVGHNREGELQYELTWDEIFSIVGPKILGPVTLKHPLIFSDVISIS